MEDWDEKCPKQLNCSSHPGKESFDIGLLPTYFSLSSSFLSCLGSLLILLAYFVLKDMRTGAQKVISLLAVADLFTALGYILGGVNYLRHFGVTDPTKCSRFHTLCEVQSFVTTWSTMCSYWWTSILAFYFFLVLVFNRSSLAGRLIPLYNILAWATPLTIMLPLLLTDNLGYAPYVASNWCYIKDTKYTNEGLVSSRKVIFLLFVGGKLWEILTYIWISVLYCIIRIKVSQRVKMMNTAPKAGRVDLRLLAIPLLYIVCRMWGTLQFFFSLSISGQIQDGCVTSRIHWAFRLFGYFQAVGDGAQGWCNAILYIFLSPAMRRRLILDPCNRCLNVTIKRAAVLLESDTKTHTTERSRLVSNTDRQYGHTGVAKNSTGHGNYSSHGTTDSIYHSLSTDEYSELPLHAGHDTDTDPSYHTVQTPVDIRNSPAVDKSSNTYVYMSASDGDSRFGSKTPDSR